ncbi:hypothetical protein VUJ46_17400 [Chryseobacterium sp. MYb264]|uniref:hypothetical protein n=1 Tax=Chryseobacterium sp. MYb264 TaxID=2745153 RepID=UPI002E111C15|nr:hypothetical protein VUJ46_17400 [Chryseobacterium sp. MYb264]
MRKIQLLLICFIIQGIMYGQSKNTSVERPVPTISSLGNYTNMPVSIQTGIPNISYNLIHVPTNNKSLSIDLSLNYHVGNVTEDTWLGDLGSGWSLLGQGFISREICNDPDESFDDKTKPGYFKNGFDDVYNYQIPGESGKFKFIRDTANNANSFRLVNLTASSSKIEYHRNSNLSTLILDSFTITNDKGIKYKFDTYNFSTATTWTWQYINGPVMYRKLKYRSAFFLTSIEDENGQQLVKFSYFKDVTYPPGMGQVVTDSESNKLSRVEITNKAIIDLQYQEKPFYSSFKSDKYNLSSLTLKTITNQFISKYNFEGNGQLDAFSKVDVNENVLEKTKFAYASSGLAPIYFPVESGVENVYGKLLLNKVTLPTGGVVEYNFEFAPFDTFPVQVITTIPAPSIDIGTVFFTQFGNARKHFFTTTENTEVYINIPNGTLSNYLWTLVFYRKVGSTYQLTPYSLGNATLEDPSNYSDVQKISVTPGEYYVALTALLPKGSIPEIAFTAGKIIGEPTTTISYEWKSYHEGLARIKNIKYYNASDVYQSNPVKIEDFDYKQFANPNLSSETYIEDGISADGISAVNPVLLYQNVKVSGGTEGHTKYYFKTPRDFAGYSEPSPYPNLNYGIKPFYIFTRQGLLYKKEVLNSSNEKVSEDFIDYSFEESGEPYPIFNTDSEKTAYTKSSWLKNQTMTSRNYFSSGVAETKKEVFNNTNNYLPNLERVTSFDGSIQETSYKYALDLNNQKLINANMTGIPLETTSVIKKNTSDAGKTVAKAETKYENAANLLPSSAVSFDSQNTLASEITFNQYDAKGNLEQYTTKDGIPVAVVWGYHKTQPIAKIEGATYSEIAPYVSDIVNKSDADINETTEQSFQQSLDTFRNNAQLKNYQITTYVYDVLVGMKSMTPPSGIREVYKYDNAGRLQRVEDENGKLLKKYEYNYKH